MTEDRKYLLALHAIPGMSSAGLMKLRQEFDTAQEAWEGTLCWKSLLGKKGAELAAKRQGINPDVIYEQFLSSGLNVVCWEDEAYPESLRPLYEPPYVLYYKGQLPPKEELAIAIVGSRNNTRYGKDAAVWFGEGLARRGVVVVSGLARGIDGAAHQGALQAGGKTVAVLGCGADVCYPKEHQKLYDEIPQQGAVVSQFPLGTPPFAANFPVRNAIISGLSRGILVVEAGERSGTSITVNYGLEQGKEIFAVPGPIFSTASAGVHRLIRDQVANLVTEPADILERFTIDHTISQPAFAFPQQGQEEDAETRNIRRLLVTPLHFDEICRTLKLAPADLMPKLFLWQMRGIIQELPGNYYTNQA